MAHMFALCATSSGFSLVMGHRWLHRSGNALFSRLNGPIPCLAEVQDGRWRSAPHCLFGETAWFLQAINAWISIRGLQKP
jgi:hypothetical protein